MWATRGAPWLAVLVVGVGASSLLGGVANSIGGSQTLNDGTTIKGNENTVSSLIDLNPQLDADVSLLNAVKQLLKGGAKGTGGALNNFGDGQTQNTGTNISGSGNKVSSLLNVGPQLDVGVNLLNKVEQTSCKAAGAGGGNNIGDSQTLNDGTTINGNENTVSNLINVNPQLDIDVNLLNAIRQITCKQGGQGGGQSSGNNIGGTQTQQSGTNINGSGNTVASLLNVNPQVGAGVNLLNNVEQIAGAGGGGGDGKGGSSAASKNFGWWIGGSQQLNSGTAIEGSGNTVASLANVNPQVGATVNLLNAVSQFGSAGANPSSGLVPGSNIGGSQTQNGGTNIEGTGNTVASLANVNPQVDAAVNLLNTVSQLGSAGGNPGSGLVPGNNIGGSQTQNGGTNIQGSGNTVASLANVNPQVGAAVNLLNTVSQLGSAGANAGSGLVPGNNIGGSQTQNGGANIQGSGNTVASLANVNPQVGAAVNLLNTVSQLGSAGGNPGSGLVPGNNIGGSQTQNGGSNIEGSGNTAANLINVNPQVDAAVNLLNAVSQLGSAGGNPGSGLVPGNNIGGSQTQNGGTTIEGTGNTVASLANVNPQVGAAVNLLNTVSQLGSAGGNPGSGLVPGNNIGGSQTQNGGTNIEGTGNTVASLANVNPQVGAAVNLLNAVSQFGSAGANPGSGLVPGNNIGGSQTQNGDTNIEGTGNTVASLANVNPQVGAAVNLLNTVSQLGSAGGSSSSGKPAAGGIVGGSGLGPGNNIGGSQTQDTGKTIVGNGNTIAELLNVNPQVDVGLNLLNSVQQTAGGLIGANSGPANNIGTQQTIKDATSIVGNDNKVFSLANVAPQIAADVNLLNAVTQGGKDDASKGGAGKDGLLGGVLGGVLGGEGPVGGLLGGDGPVGGLLGADGPVGGLLGADGPVGGLLGADGPVGGLLGADGPVGGLLGADGPVGGLLGSNGLVGGLLGGNGPEGGLLGSAGPVGGLLGGGGPVGGLLGENGPVGGLLGGPVGGLLGGDGPVDGLLGKSGPVEGVLGGTGPVSSLLGADGPVGVSGGSGGGINQIGSQQQINDGTSIRGDNNQVSTLANVKPQIGVNLQLLNQVQQAIGGPFPHPNDDTLVCQNFIGGVQQQNSGTNIVGDGNKVITGIDVSPQINVDLNLLNSVRQVVICRPRPTIRPTLSTIRPTLPTIRPPTRPPTKPTVKPPTKPPTRPPPTIRPTLPPYPPTLPPYPPTLPPYPPTLPPTTPTLPPVPPTEAPCVEVNNIGGTQEQLSGTSIVGDNNQVLSGINVNPQVNLGVNLLNAVQQTQGRPLVICKPTPTPPPPTPPPTPTTTPKPSTLPPIPPTLPTRRCYVRYCRRWGHKLSHHCYNNCLPPTLPPPIIPAPPILPPPTLAPPILPLTPRPYPILSPTPPPHAILSPILPPHYPQYPQYF